MSYSLRQVLPLLNKPELALFEDSRAGAVKELTARQLVSKIARARALRDKYRDTYRRQTVRTQTGPANARAQMGGENSRTDVKATVMDEVLQRLQVQHEKLQARQSKADAAAARAAATTASPRRRAGDAQAGPGADLPMRGATKKPKRDSARQRSAAQEAQAVVAARGNPSARTKAAAAAGAAAPARAGAKKAATGKSGRRNRDENAITGAAKPAAKLMRQVRGALEKQQAEPPVEGTPTRRRSIRAKVGGTPSDNAQGAVPTNMPALAQRMNPLKAEPINKTIHASARSRQQAATAKRNAR